MWHKTSSLLKSSLVYWTVLVSLALMGGIQAAGMANRSLAVDDPWSANFVRMPWSEFWSQLAYDPAYLLLLKGWTVLFGESEVALRSLSILLYMVMIVVVGIVAHNLGGRFAGIAASWLAAASYMGVTQAVTVRCYAMLGALTAVSLLITLQLLSIRLRDTPDTESSHARPTWWLYLGYVGVGAVGLFTHTTYIFVLAALTGSALLVSWRRFWQLAVCSALAGGIYLLLWFPRLVSMLGSAMINWMEVPDGAAYLNGFANLWGLQKTLLVAATLLVVIVLNWRTARLMLVSPAGRALVSMVFLVTGLPFIVSQFRPVYQETRTPILWLPIISVAVALFFSRFRWKWLPLGALVVLAVFAARWAWQQHAADDPWPARASVGEVVARARCGDTLVMTGLSISEVQYYLRRLNAPICLQQAVYPAEVGQHPGWVDVPGMLRQSLALQSESATLARQLTRQPGTQVWVFYSAQSTSYAHELAQVLKSEFDREIGTPQLLDWKGSFFDSVLLYTPTAGQAPSQ